MSRFIYSPKARSDLFDIGVFIERDSPARAAAYVAKLEVKVARIARRPLACRKRDDLEPGLRSAPFGNHLILFRIVDGGIEIARVVHGARDLPSLFGKTS